MIDFLIRITLMVLALLIVVPACTGGRVAVRRGGFLRGLLALIVLGLINSALWYVFALVTIGGAILLNWLTFGLVGLASNALGFLLAGKLMPEVLRVDGFWPAAGASLVMTVASCLIHLLL